MVRNEKYQNILTDFLGEKLQQHQKEAVAISDDTLTIF